MGNKSKMSVSFDVVTIREFDIVLSTNPASLSGPAIELGWDYQLATEVQPLTKRKRKRLQVPGTLSVQEYEELRPSPQRRNLTSLYLFLNQREYRLKVLRDYTDEDIKEAVEEKKIISKSRDRSNFYQSPTKKFSHNVTSVNRNRKIKRAVRNLKRRKQPSYTHRDIYSGWWLPLSAYFF